MPDEKSKLDPTAPRGICFQFNRCQVRTVGDTLVVSVPTPSVRMRSGRSVDTVGGLQWSDWQDAPAQVRVDCQPGHRVRHDAREYPQTVAYPGSTTFTFSGGISYGRVLAGDAWALHVEGRVTAIAGLPADWMDHDAILVHTDSTTPEKRPSGQAQGPAAQLPAAAAVSTTTAGSGGGDLGDGTYNGPHMPFP